MLILAQGAPSDILLGLCPLIAGFFIVISIITGMMILRSRSRESVQEPGRLKKAVKGVFGLSCCLVLVCVIAGFSLLESFPAHAWRKAVHTTTISIVNADTGKPLAADIHRSYSGAEEDPFFVWSAGSVNDGPWTLHWNVPGTLTCTADGYIDVLLEISTSSPSSIVVRMNTKSLYVSTLPGK